MLYLTSLEAVAPSLVLLEKVLAKTNLPVWINADVLPGPGGHVQPLDPQAFLSAVRDLPPHMVLSLGWTTGWTAGIDNPGNPDNWSSQLLNCVNQKYSNCKRLNFSMETINSGCLSGCGPHQDLGAVGSVGSGSWSGFSISVLEHP